MYQPIFSRNTGWILGRIQDYVAKRLSEDEIEELCRKLNGEGKPPKAKKVVYICHPVGGDISGNIEKILKIVRRINLTRPDIVPFVPYMADILIMDDNNPAERERGIENSMAIFNSGMVDELWVIDPRISPGMKAEIDMAAKMNIPVITITPISL